MEEKNINQINKEYDLPIFETKRLILRPFKIEDAADIFEYASDAENTKYMLFDTHKTIEDATSFINFTISKYKEKKYLDYVFVLKDSNKVIGSGGVGSLDKAPHNVEIGYIINKKYWGMGYAKEAITKIIEYCFQVLDIHRIEGRHFSENINSGKVMQKLGMKYEGEQQDKIFIRGNYINIKNYSIINPKHSRE